MRLTYCSNIHPAESWEDLRRALCDNLPEVKSGCSPDAPFPLGIWLSNQAVQQCDGQQQGRFADWCEAHGCYVLTLNGFPHGSFHQGVVKQQVYLPDWRSPRRAEYSCRLATLLDRWLPQGEPGSISTVPVGWGSQIKNGDLAQVRQNLLAVLEHMDRLRQHSGKQIVLALEPEPGCHLQSTEDVLSFFGTLALPEDLRPLLGLCYDCCHQAVLFEDPEQSLRALQTARIPLAKVQLSSALRLPAGGDPACLRPFAEDRYLHQTVIRSDGRLWAHSDLPQALASQAGQRGEWRVHLHVPIFLQQLGHGLATTRPFLERVLQLVDPAVPLEVETYSFSVLPAELQQQRLTDSIVRELRWVLKQRAGATAPASQEQR